MQPYTGFASVYDMFMDNVPYEEWAEYICDLLRRHQINSGLVLELGCGTGNLTRQLAAKGYDMIGVDNSEEMLSIARDKSENSDDSILYLCQDMREFELYGTVSAAISVCDSMNYILSEEELLQIFQLVNNYLDPQGIFIFDYDTPYAYKEIIGDSTIAENREEGSFIWENTYYEEEQLNEINLTLFIPEKASDRKQLPEGKRYYKYEETHYRRAFSIDKVKRLIEEAGMECVAVYDMLSESEPRKDSDRVYFVAREKRQENKLYL